MSKKDRESIVVRRAIPDDCFALSILFDDLYSNPGRPAKYHYPFPQYLDEDWQRKACSGDQFVWVLAVVGGVTAGCFGAKFDKNSSNTNDLVAEQTGMVVRPEFRGRGLAHKMMAELCLHLADARIVLAESRTEEPGGWKAASKAGFVPIGYEPYAHKMPNSYEAMLVMGLIPATTLKNRYNDFSVTKAAKALADIVCPLFSIESPTLANAMGPSELNPKPYFSDLDQKKSKMSHMAEKKSEYWVHKKVTKETALSILDSLDSSNHLSGVVCLDRLEGWDHTGLRYVDEYWLLKNGNLPLAITRVMIDNSDRRARILLHQSKSANAKEYALHDITHRLMSLNREARPKSIVIEVCASQLGLLFFLEGLDFVPTVYFPAMLLSESKAHDCIQYAKYINCDLSIDIEIANKLGTNGVKLMKHVSSFNMKDDL